MKFDGVTLRVKKIIDLGEVDSLLFVMVVLVQSFWRCMCESVLVICLCRSDSGCMCMSNVYGNKRVLSCVKY